MNKQLLVLIVGTALFLSNMAVGQSKAISGRRDTTLALVAHMDYGLKSVTYGPANRIKGDSIAIIQVDADTWKRKKVSFTYYDVEVRPLVDSILAKAYNVQMFDSTGRQNRITLRLQAPSMYVRDTITDLNKAFKSLEQYIIKDSTQKK